MDMNTIKAKGMKKSTSSSISLSTFFSQRIIQRKLIFTRKIVSLKAHLVTIILDDR